MKTPVALILVDIQNDFLEGGSLAVPNASNIFPAVHKLLDKANLVIATQDWHPANHVSFSINHPGKQPFDETMVQYDECETKQVLWPAHCVQNTRGAEISKRIPEESINYVVQKGMNPKFDSYSGFADNDYREITPLAKILFQNHVETVIIVGLAADYCVKMTCLDSIKFGFKTILVREGTLAVAPELFNDTMSYLQSKGVEITDVDHAIKALLQ